MLKPLTYLIVALTALPLLADDPTPIPLWSATELTPKPDPAKPEKGIVRDIGRWVGDVSEPTISVYSPPADKNTGCAVVICPGGGYGGLALDWEGHDVAKWFNTFGVTGVVLKYRMPRPDVTKDGTPLPLLDSRKALQLVRSHAEEWKIDPKRVGIMGFSAGGHLAATTGTHTESPDAGTRPDFMILAYPVITFDATVGHSGSRANLIGKSPDEKLVELYSNEKQVTAQTPPTFLVHAADDPVKVENSKLFFEALRAKKVPCEFVQLGSGGHGFGLGKPPRGNPETSAWPNQCEAWLRGRKLLSATP